VISDKPGCTLPSEMDNEGFVGPLATTRSKGSGVGACDLKEFDKIEIIW
jgi:hypothetical protein